MLTRRSYEEEPRPPMSIPEVVTAKDVATFRREYEKADEATKKWADRRAALGPGASRARVTTCNARWSTAAEHRDRLLDRLERAEAALVAQSNSSATLTSSAP